MGYYQGDFYAGARGDPFWGALVGIARRVGGALLGGGLGGGVAKAAAPAAAGMAASRSSQIISAGRAIMQRGAGAIIKHPVLSAAGAAGVAGAMGAVGERMIHPGAVAHKGFHMNKHGKMVRNRRMNVANGRALSRATRRLHAFAKRYRKVVGFVSPRKPKGHMYFKRRRSKK